MSTFLRETKNLGELESAELRTTIIASGVEMNANARKVDARNDYRSFLRTLVFVGRVSRSTSFAVARQSIVHDWLFTAVVKPPLPINLQRLSIVSAV